MKTPRSAILIAAMLILLEGCDKKPDSTAPAVGSPAAALPGETIRAVRGVFPNPVPEGEALNSLLKSHTKDIERLMESLKSSDCGFEVDYSPGMGTILPHLGEARPMARILVADAKRLLAAGDADGAARRIASILRISVNLTCKAQTLIELLVGTAVAELALDCVRTHPELARAAWKTDIQQAIAAVQQSDVLNSTALVRADLDMMARSLREGKMIAFEGSARDWTKASQAERDAAAAHISSLAEEYLRAWKLPDAAASAAKLDAITTRERTSPGGDLLPPFSKARPAVEKVRASLKEISALLSK